MDAPQRIASLLSSATEVLYALGLADRVVAVSHECDFPPEVRDKPRVTISHVDSAAASDAIDHQVKQMLKKGDPLYGIDVPLLASLRPDLIITQAQCDVCAVRYEDVLTAVKQDDIFQNTKVVALNPQTPKDILDDIYTVGSAAGCADAALDYVGSLQARVNAVRSKTSWPSQQRPHVACIEWIEPLMLSGNWIPELIHWAGGFNGLTVASQPSRYAQWQQVFDDDPQVIIVSPCGFDLERTIAEAQTLTSVPGWSDLTAVRTGRVYAVDGNAYLNRAGPRIVDSLEILAQLIHPELGIQPPEPAKQAFRALQL